MTLDVFHREKYYSVKILDYIKENNTSYFKTLCGNFEYKIQCGSFLRGNFTGVVNYKTPSKNKFEYSKQYNCWLGWTQKDEKFAFDGDEETVKLIINNTWYFTQNKLYCCRLKKSLHQLVLGVSDTRKTPIRHKTNNLELKSKYFDNRKSNLFIDYTKNSTKHNRKRKKNATYEMTLSSDKTFYLVKDENGKCFKIDNNENSLNILKEDLYVVKERNFKKYVTGVKDYHRVLFDLTDSKYSEWFIDHINGDGTDNRLQNLVITDHYGNMCNKISKGYSPMKSGKFKVHYMREYPYEKNVISKKWKVFNTEEEAVEEVKKRREYILKHRLSFKSKDELDNYLHKVDYNKY